MLGVRFDDSGLGGVTGEPVVPQLPEVARRMFDLARFGDTEELASPIDRRAPVDLIDERGDTLLLAACCGQAVAVAALPARGADHSRVDDEGRTALAAAVSKQSAETVGHLLAAGAHPDLGGQSARATAEFIELAAMTELLAAPRWPAGGAVRGFRCAAGSS